LIDNLQQFITKIQLYIFSLLKTNNTSLFPIIRSLKCNILCRILRNLYFW